MTGKMASFKSQKASCSAAGKQLQEMRRWHTCSGVPPISAAVASAETNVRFCSSLNFCTRRQTQSQGIGGGGGDDDDDDGGGDGGGWPLH